MKKFTRIHVAAQMAETGVVPVFYHPDIEVCQHLIQACYDGGIRVFEFTNRGDRAHEVFTQLTKYCGQHCPEMILGTGSITDGATAVMFIQNGARFIVSPFLKEDIATICNHRKILWSAGCGTLTEINRAEELGAEIVKLFPGSQMGPGFVKAIKGPCPWTSVMPTGGVTTQEDNLRQWFHSGVTCVGIGSELFNEVLKDKNYIKFKGRVQMLMETVQRIRL